MAPRKRDIGEVDDTDGPETKKQVGKKAAPKQPNPRDQEEQEDGAWYDGRDGLEYWFSERVKEEVNSYTIFLPGRNYVHWKNGRQWFPNSAQTKTRLKHPIPQLEEEKTEPREELKSKPRPLSRPRVKPLPKRETQKPHLKTPKSKKKEQKTQPTEEEQKTPCLMFSSFISLSLKQYISPSIE